MKTIITVYYTLQGYTSGEVKDEKNEFLGHNKTDPYRTLDLLLTPLSASRQCGPFRGEVLREGDNDQNTIDYVLFGGETQVRLNLIQDYNYVFSRGIAFPDYHVKARVRHWGKRVPKLLERVMNRCNIISKGSGLTIRLDDLVDRRARDLPHMFPSRINTQQIKTDN